MGEISFLPSVRAGSWPSVAEGRVMASVTSSPGGASPRVCFQPAWCRKERREEEGPGMAGTFQNLTASLASVPTHGKLSKEEKACRIRKGIISTIVLTVLRLRHLASES